MKEISFKIKQLEKQIKASENESDLYDVRVEIVKAFSDKKITLQDRNFLWGVLQKKSIELVNPKKNTNFSS
jgi:hypothetical protein